MKTRHRLREGICYTYNHQMTYNLKFLQTNKAKTDKPVETHARDLYRHFAKEEILMTKEYSQWCSTSLVIREMQI